MSLKLFSHRFSEDVRRSAKYSIPFLGFSYPSNLPRSGVEWQVLEEGLKWKRKSRWTRTCSSRQRRPRNSFKPDINLSSHFFSNFFSFCLALMLTRRRMMGAITGPAFRHKSKHRINNSSSFEGHRSAVPNGLGDSLFVNSSWDTSPIYNFLPHLFGIYEHI